MQPFQFQQGLVGKNKIIRFPFTEFDLHFSSKRYFASNLPKNGMFCIIAIKKRSLLSGVWNLHVTSFKRGNFLRGLSSLIFTVVYANIMPDRCAVFCCSNDASLEKGISLRHIPFFNDDSVQAKKRKRWVILWIWLVTSGRHQ